MTREPDHVEVLAFYRDKCRPRHVEPLGSAGGFSGARFWRVTADTGTYCLRRWPQQHPSIERLQFIQAVLWYVAREGFKLVPLPLENRHSGGYVEHAGHLWELAPWMPGQADFRDDPTAARLAAAMVALARFHLAAATFPLPDESLSRSPGIDGRLAQLRDWMSSGIPRLAGSICPGDWPEMESRARRIVRLFPGAAPDVLARLGRAAEHEVALQPCIRDIWHDHVLYQGNRVSGLIDFGSMRADNVATDVARLLGSLAGDEPALWQAGLRAYQDLRPLSAAETELVAAFDRSTVLMAGLNWLEWVYCEGRRFENRQAVFERLDAILPRLEHLAGGA